VGHVLLALPSQSQRDVVQTGLRLDGWPDDELIEFEPRESVPELEQMIERSSGAAGFGYEITLMRRYLDLARSGHVWLLVKVDGEDEAQRVAQLARLYGAGSAVHYRTFTVEDLL
jgi:hypothetical protein